MWRFHFYEDVSPPWAIMVDNIRISEVVIIRVIATILNGK